MAQDDTSIAAELLQDIRSHSHSDADAFAALQLELRRIARSKMRLERDDHTLQPTALVNEAFIKLFKSHIPPDFWTDPTRAVAYIGRAMGQILIDHADAYRALKRGGGNLRVPLDKDQAREFRDDGNVGEVDRALLVRPEQSEEVLAVRDALISLRETSPRQARVIELLYYGGLTQDETAAVLDVSPETVKLDARKAKAFLKTRLAGK